MTTVTATTLRRCRGEDGTFVGWVLVMIVPMMAMAGLVFDGGHVLAERRESLDAAQNAALAGVQAIDGGRVRGGEVVLDAGLVRAAVEDYLAANGFVGSVSVGEREVTVTVTQEVEMQLLGTIGVADKTVSGTATARISRGVEGADT